jgi:hypothetical protein
MTAIAASRPTSLPPIALSFAGVLAALAAMVLGVVAPLAVYSISLAAFGLPHVLSELRYVDRRFGRRLGAPTVIVMTALLASIVAARAGVIAHLLAPGFETPLELGLVAALALAAARGGAVTRAAAVGVALLIGALAIVDPFETMVGFSVLHNLTPLGFLWQLAPRSRRPAAMGWGRRGLRWSISSASWSGRSRRTASDRQLPESPRGEKRPATAPPFRRFRIVARGGERLGAGWSQHGVALHT